MSPILASVVLVAAASLPAAEADSSTASGYTHIPAACVSGNNIELHKGKTVAECAAICDANALCLAFEYGVDHGGSGTYYKAGDCQEQSSAEDIVYDCTNHNLDLYVKDGYVMDDSTIRTAVAAWLSDATAAEATYGHISTWRTEGVTDMSYLFCAISNWGSYGCNSAAASFNEDIGAWDTSGVTRMVGMFRAASAFDQDLGWCVDGVAWGNAFYGTPCASTLCGIGANMATLVCGGEPHDDSTIRAAVSAWIGDPTAAEATYGHISTWKTGGVTDMSQLFDGKTSFNEDIGAWDTSGVKDMEEMFREASAFNQDLSDWRFDSVTDMNHMFEDASALDQDLGWCVGNKVILARAFRNTPCASTSCGVAMQDVFGICEPWARPCLIGTDRQCEINSPTLIIIIVLVLLAGFGACVCCRKKKDETYIAAARRVLRGCLRCGYPCCRKKTERSNGEFRPDSPTESPQDEPYEEATDLESAAETVEPSSFSKIFTSFFFGEQAPMEETPKEEEATALAVKKRTYSVSVPPGPIHVLFLYGTCRVHAVKRASPLWGMMKKGETLMSVNGKPVTPATMFDVIKAADDGTSKRELVFQRTSPQVGRLSNTRPADPFADADSLYEALPAAPPPAPAAEPSSINTRPDSPAESPPEEATAPKETEATAVAPEAEESPQETLAEEPPPPLPPAKSWFGRARPEPEPEEAEETAVDEPPPPPAKSWFWRKESELEPEEAEQPPPLSPFSALRAERERELKTFASP